jgi:hypothetical protein
MDEVMSNGWCVILEREIDGVTVASTAGRSLLYYQRQIDELAEKLGLTPISTFFSRDPNEIADYLRRQGVEPDMDQLPDEEWFEAIEGLATVSGLLNHLRADTAGVPEPGKIIADLDLVQQTLAIAAEQSTRFHLGRVLPESIEEMRKPD